ncbi:MAG: hypothetical protein WDZ35_09270 [Crocinitomicaceae bacterium]
MKWVRNITVIVFTIFVSGFVYGQRHTATAYEYYKKEQFDSAQYWIDSAIVSDERSNSQTWQLRGIIYRKLETADKKSYRDISIESFVQAKNLDVDGVYAEKINDYMKNTIIRYYNDAVIALENGDLEEAVDSYKSYKLKTKKYLSHLQQTFEKEDYEFYDVIGTAYLHKSRRLDGEQKEQAISKAIHFCEKAIAVDSNQFSPNYSLGVLHYNRGADFIMNMDPLTPIEEIPEIEKKAQDGFKKALPYLLRAHQINPEHTDVIEAITGCYFGLYGSNDEQYMKYQKILDEKRLPELLEKHEKDPKDRETIKQLLRIYSTTFEDQEKYLEFSKKLNTLDG